ncbi:MAG: type II toxin-antitoxin system HicA family toxin [Rhodospirillales bacterium]|nr:MAG: type II toxin-antitoxin system HicA family toxin [Rhodospirillales bacterium]
MRNNPRDQRIEDLKRLADRYGIDYRQPGTSHVTFSYPGLLPLPVPARKPIKPIYVKLFLELIDQIEGEDHG